tara:strand:+ start:322 stop:1515 length:1194 start_codon:yes stop_codon:yes gene_type:complete
MWLPVGKIIVTIILLLTTNAGDAGSPNPADQIAGYPPGKASNVNYYRDKFEQVKQELEALKEKHKKHESDPYTMGIEYMPEYGETVKRIRDRGYMICGSYNDKPGFSEKRGGNWDGFEIEICRAIAIAVMGEEWSIKTVEVNSKTRFEYLFDGTVDIILATTTWTYSRDVEWRIEFMPTTYYDGQGFIVRKSLGVKSAKDLTGARVCYGENSTAAQNIKDFFELWDVDYIPVPLKAGESATDFYIDGECDMYGTDRSALAGRKSTFSDPNSHVILPEIISKEPLGPAVKYGDQQFSDIVRWAIYVLFLAEEFGIDQVNIDDFSSNKDPMIQIFMGERGELGAKLGISETFAYDIISQVGNYKEIFEMHLGKSTRLGLNRGLNKLYKDGGLLYSPPLK